MPFSMCISNQTQVKCAKIHSRVLKRSRSLLNKRYWWILIVYAITQYSILVIAPVLNFLTPLDKLHASIYGNILGFTLGMIVILMLLRSEMGAQREPGVATVGDRKSTRLNSSHVAISYAVFCLNNKRVGYDLSVG